MDSTTLVSPPNLEEGRKAVQAVKASRIPIRQGFWAYFTDAHEWRLVLVTTWLSTKGPRATYSAVLKALAKRKLEFPLSQISLARPGDPLATAGMRAGREAEPFGHGRWRTVENQNVAINPDYVYSAVSSQRARH